MRWMTVTAALVCALGAGGLVGCGSGASSSSPPSTAASTQTTSAPAGAKAGDDSAGAELLEHHGHHHGGVAMFLNMSLGSLGLDGAAQASVEKVRADLAAKLEPVRAAQAALLGALADGVAAGNVDKAKVDAALAQFDGAEAAAAAASNDALNQLHGILDAGQRAALAQKLEAHWEVWQEANREDPSAPTPPHDGALARLASSLSLTSDQVDRIRATLRGAAPQGGALPPMEPRDVDARLKAFAAAFQADTFDAKTLNGGEGVKLHLADRGVRRMAHLYEAAAPVLTPDQRTKLAARLKEHAAQEGK